MKKEYVLTSPDVIADDFRYVYSPISKDYPIFAFADGAAVNAYHADRGDYDYVSIVTKERYGTGTTATAKCAFDHYGAPLIVLTDDIRTGGDGIDRYGLHFEVVVYENGINVWHIVPWPERTVRPIKPTLIAQRKFTLEDASLIDLSVSVGKKKLLICANGVELIAEHPDVPERFHIGITACENINRFYSFAVEN